MSSKQNTGPRTLPFPHYSLYPSFPLFHTENIEILVTNILLNIYHINTIKIILLYQSLAHISI